MCKIPDYQQLDLASIHMSDRAESWFNSYIATRIFVEWDDFVLDVCARFKEDIGVNVVEEFNKLVQTGTIDDYLDAFENPRALMVQRSILFGQLCGWS